MTIRKKNSNHFDGVAVVIVLVVVVAQVWPRQGPRATNGPQILLMANQLFLSKSKYIKNYTSPILVCKCYNIFFSINLNIFLF